MYLFSRKNTSSSEEFHETENLPPGGSNASTRRSALRRRLALSLWWPSLANTGRTWRSGRREIHKRHTCRQELLKDGNAAQPRWIMEGAPLSPRTALGATLLRHFIVPWPRGPCEHRHEPIPMHRKTRLESHSNSKTERAHPPAVDMLWSSWRRTCPSWSGSEKTSGRSRKEKT